MLFRAAVAWAAAPGGVIINEVMWGGSSVSIVDEWIELRNTTSGTIDLVDWTLTGAGTSGQIITLPSGSLITPNGYFLIANNGKDYAFSYGTSILAVDPDYVTSTLSLSNSTLNIQLKDSVGAVIDVAGDGGAPLAGENLTDKKSAMERRATSGDGTISGSWYTSTGTTNLDAGVMDRATPKAANSTEPSSTVPPTPVAPSPEEEEESGSVSLVSIASARSFPKGSAAVVEGVVTVLPGVLSSQYFYVQDDTASIQIYSSKKLFPDTHIGQRLRITGEMSEANNEKRIKIFAASDAVATGSGGAQPRSIRPGEVGESQEGMLVRITGKVVDPSGSTFFIEDETGRVKIYVKKETGIVKPRFQKGDAIAVVGIVSQYKSEYRVLPREQADLITETEEEMEEVETEEADESGEGSGLEENTSARVTSVKGAQSERPASRSFLGWALMLSGVLFVLLPLALWMVAARQPETAEKLRNWLARLRSRFGRGMS